MIKALLPVFWKTRTETETRFKIEFFYGPKPRRDPGLNFFTDQNRDEVQIIGRSPGRLRKQEKGEGKQLP